MRSDGFLKISEGPFTRTEYLFRSSEGPLMRLEGPFQVIREDPLRRSPESFGLSEALQTLKGPSQISGGPSGTQPFRRYEVPFRHTAGFFRISEDPFRRTEDPLGAHGDPWGT